MSNQIALVTGGAAGIGKATAMKLASRGVTVVISDFRAEAGDAASSDIEAVASAGAQVRFIQNDVRSETAVKAMIGQIVAEFGQLDMAVNNAGICNEAAPLDKSDSDKYRNMVDTNILGTYFCMKYEIIEMKRKGSGSIVNLSSITGLNGMATVAAYASTKHAITGLTKSAAMDHATEGLRINAVAPGAVATDMAIQGARNAGLDYDEELFASLQPMNRVGRPEEIANGIVWLLSDEASYITGHVLSLDGGDNAR